MLQRLPAIPENYFTVYYNLFTRSRLAPGETLLVHGGSSGIGLAAIQLAKACGATVITTAGTDEKCAFCESAGADKAVNYRTEDWPGIVREIAGKTKVDVVLDMVAGDYIQKNIDLLGRDGRYALIAFLGGSTAEVNFGKVMMNRLSISGSTLRPQSLDEKARIASDVEHTVWPMFENKTVRPHIHCTYPLKQAAQAHHLMMKGGGELPSTVTADYSVKMKRPTPTEKGKIHLVAKIVESTQDRATVEAELEADGKICATCVGTFVAVKPGHPAYHRW